MLRALTLCVALAAPVQAPVPAPAPIEQTPSAESPLPLPCAVVARLCLDAALEDLRQIDARLWICSGWHAAELQELWPCDERLVEVWTAAVGSLDLELLPYGDDPECRPRMYWRSREEWVEILVELIGERAYWRGELPLPLSCR